MGAVLSFALKGIPWMCYTDDRSIWTRAKILSSGWNKEVKSSLHKNMISTGYLSTLSWNFSFFAVSFRLPIVTVTGVLNEINVLLLDWIKKKWYYPRDCRNHELQATSNKKYFAAEVIILIIKQMIFYGISW